MKKNKLLSYLGIMLLVLHPIFASAQDRTISGKVVDQKGEGLLGATVKPKSGKPGVSTDGTGSFKITLSSDEKALVVSYLGYQQKEVAINASTSSITISLVQETNNLSEVVV